MSAVRSSSAVGAVFEFDISFPAMSFNRAAVRTISRPRVSGRGLVLAGNVKWSVCWM
jgi:hypothetical protein